MAPDDRPRPGVESDDLAVEPGRRRAGRCRRRRPSPLVEKRHVDDPVRDGRRGGGAAARLVAPARPPGRGLDGVEHARVVRDVRSAVGDHGRELEQVPRPERPLDPERGPQPAREEAEPPRVVAVGRPVDTRQRCGNGGLLRRRRGRRRRLGRGELLRRGAADVTRGALEVQVVPEACPADEHERDRDPGDDPPPLLPAEAHSDGELGGEPLDAVGAADPDARERVQVARAGEPVICRRRAEEPRRLDRGDDGVVIPAGGVTEEVHRHVEARADRLTRPGDLVAELRRARPSSDRDA